MLSRVKAVLGTFTGSSCSLVVHVFHDPSHRFEGKFKLVADEEGCKNYFKLCRDIIDFILSTLQILVKNCHSDNSAIEHLYARRLNV